MRSLAFALALSLCTFFLHTDVSSAQGPLKVVGTGDGLEMLQEIGAGFVENRPDINLEIPPSIGSGGGIKQIKAMGRGPQRFFDDCVWSDPCNMTIPATSSPSLS